MKIIIVGIGKVGITLANFFSREGHDVTVIDKNQKLINDVVNKYDVMGVCGNGVSLEVLDEADIKNTDILIASASTDETNMLVCVLAKKMGVKNTIARIRNPEYAVKAGSVYNELGITMIANPEFNAAEEIYRIIRFPSALKLEKFAGGSIDIAEIAITEGHPLEGTLLCDLRSHSKVQTLICAAKRGEDVIIPSGNFEIKAGDIIYIIASHSELLLFFKELNLLKKKIRSVMIIGGSKIAFYLSRMLLKQGIDVKIIETDAERCEELANFLPKAVIVNADGTDGDVLIEEGIDDMDACVMLTNIDEENIIISLFAGSRNVGKIITKVSRNSLVSMMPQVDSNNSIISPTFLLANNIVRFVRSIGNAEDESNIETLHKIVDNNAEAIEFSMREGSFQKFGVPLKDIPLKLNILIACIKRQNTVILPNGNTTIELGDRVIIVTTNEGLTKMDDILA